MRSGIGRKDRTAEDVRKAPEFASMQMAVSRNHRSPKINAILAGIWCRGEMQRGSVGLKIGLIAEQTCDLCIHLSHRTSSGIHVPADNS
ncbi:MAG: hypothetical protein IPM21_10900 [Acidobacteria bacterium]|nr:hypothetical protein [Acidobacteriota bacterium]